MDSSERLIHSCDQIPSEGVSIRVGTACFDGENLGWCLFIERLAAEEDLLENHYLEEVGESIWTTVVEIKFCPYCAVELVDVDPVGAPDEFGRFFHIDSTGWQSRRR